ncbi:MAG TPA: HTH domain-containing protein [Beutenbergiaceae bacterium]|nr:HTH domain-containing protein [Beutenbergiaceae bacterium]
MASSIADAAAASRDNHLTLRRVERQQHLIERLCTAAARVPLGRLAEEFGVAERTIARDISRLRHSGAPITVRAGRAGGAAIERSVPLGPITLDLPETAALIASLAALGPTASQSAASAMAKLTAALQPE